MATTTTAVQKRTAVPAELQGRGIGAYTFDELYRLAQACHASGLFEDTTDASQALVKIFKGQELGLPPTTAMTAFDIIKKRLFIKPWAIAAKINACGYGGYRIDHQSPEQCTIVFLRKYPGKGWVECPPVTYTHAEAKAHGLVDRSPHWKASPAHMLYQRAMGRGGAMYFPELLAGLEMPPDDAPISREQRAQHVSELFGEPMGGMAPQREPTTSAREAGTGETSPSPTQSRLREGTTGYPDAKKEPSELAQAWNTLCRYQDDARLPEALLERIKYALSGDDPVGDQGLLQLASAILDQLNDAEKDPALPL